MQVTAVAKFTAKTTNSEKAIYFLSLMSANKLKSPMLFTRKDFTLSNFTKKKTSGSEDGGATGAQLNKSQRRFNWYLNETDGFETS